jgi:Flp pilus assembly protein TadG
MPGQKSQPIYGSVMKRRISLHRQEGAAAVEFALIMVVLLTILFGIIEFGIAISKVEVYISAAREGARLAAVRCNSNPACSPGDPRIAARVTSAATGYPVGPGTPSADIECTNDTLGDPVTVSWDQQITIDVPFVPGLSPLVIDRTIQGVFACE